MPGRNRISLLARVVSAAFSAAVIPVGVSAAEASSLGAPDIRGIWKGAATAKGQQYPAVWVVTSENLSTGHFEAHVQGNPAYTMSGTVGGGSWTDTSGTGSYVSTTHGTLSVKGDLMVASGSFSDSNGVRGTWTLTHAVVKAKLDISLTLPKLTPADREPNGVIPNIAEGDDGVVVVTITAHGGDFKDVYLRSGGVRVMCGAEFVKVAASPAEASGFPLSEGATRRFQVRVVGLRWGSGTISVDVRGVTESGKTSDVSKDRKASCRERVSSPV